MNAGSQCSACGGFYNGNCPHWPKCVPDTSYKDREITLLNDLVLTLNRKLVLAEHKMWDFEPMGTAPKDGTPVLGFVPSYFRGKGGWAVVLWQDGAWWDNQAFKTDPTCWTKLPPDPEGIFG